MVPNTHATKKISAELTIKYNEVLMCADKEWNKQIGRTWEKGKIICEKLISKKTLIFFVEG